MTTAISRLAVALMALLFIGCREDQPTDKSLEFEAVLHYQALNYCSCHGGLAWRLYLPEYGAMRVRCSDTNTKYILWHQEFKPCDIKETK